MYKLIEKVVEYQEKKKKEIEKAKIMKLASICEIEIMPEHIFHNSNPAVFGIKIVGGRLKSGTPLINNQGEKISEVKKIQSENKGIDEATIGMEVAISLPGINFQRHLAEEKNLYSDLGPVQFREFKKNKDILSKDEVAVLQKIAQIKRKKEPTWGV